LRHHTICTPSVPMKANVRCTRVISMFQRHPLVVRYRSTIKSAASTQPPQTVSLRFPSKTRHFQVIHPAASWSQKIALRTLRARLLETRAFHGTQLFNKTHGPSSGEKPCLNCRIFRTTMKTIWQLACMGGSPGREHWTMSRACEISGRPSAARRSE
jgi:hypothetical protein